jgi:hypothetical protein
VKVGNRASSARDKELARCTLPGALVPPVVVVVVVAVAREDEGEGKGETKDEEGA